MKKLFKLRGELDGQISLILAVVGLGIVLLIWIALTSGQPPILNSAVLPSPGRVLGAFGDLYQDNEIIKNTCLSIGLNMAGYVEALLIALPIGFLIGLFPFFRGSFQMQVAAIRYVPLTALVGLFIVWFGIGIPMKTHFLAFGIVIYLLPIIVQRIYEVNDVYLKTVYTLGATDWQTIKTVYLPSVMSRLSDDVRVLTAISWTYIIVAENIGGQGGIGSLIWKVGQRQGRVDKVFAMLIIIMIFGVLQDKVFARLDKEFFPHKYQVKDSHKKGALKEESVLEVMFEYATQVFSWLLIGVYVLLFANEFIPIIGEGKVLSYLFGDTVWVIHGLMWLMILYRVYHFFDKRNKVMASPPLVST